MTFSLILKAFNIRPSYHRSTQEDRKGSYLAQEERKVMVTERFTSPLNMAVCMIYKIYTYRHSINPFPHGMFWTKVIYDLASSEPYSLSSLNRKNLKKYIIVQKDLGNTL